MGLIFLLYTPLHAQDDQLYCLFINGRDVTFKNVYEMPGTPSNKVKEDVLNMLKANGVFIHDIEEKEDRITCNFSNLTMDYKRYGKHAMNTTFYIQTSTFSGNAEIDIKDNKYRVKITRIIFDPNVSGTVYSSGNNTGVGVTYGYGPTPIEYAIEKKHKPQFKGSQHDNIQMISSELRRLFDVNAFLASKKDDNW